MELIHIAESHEKNGVEPVISSSTRGTLQRQIILYGTAPAPTFAQGDTITMEGMNMYVWSLWNRLSGSIQKL